MVEVVSHLHEIVLHRDAEDNGWPGPPTLAVRTTDATAVQQPSREANGIDATTGKSGRAV